MKTRTMCAVLVAMAFLSNLTFAANVVSRQVRYIGNPAFTWKDGSIMNVTNIVIGVVDKNMNGIEPPSTNPANGYVGSGDVKSVNASTPLAVGYDGSVFYSQLLVTGQCMGIIEGAITGTYQEVIEGGVTNYYNAIGKGIYRSFSAMSIPAAAYYADGLQVNLENPLPAPINTYGTYQNSLINPAYNQMVFDVAPTATLTTVSGSVNSIAGGANNLLDNDDIMVYYRTTAPGAWSALSAFSINGNGDFSGAYSGSITQLMVGIVISADTLPKSSPVVPTILGSQPSDVENFVITLSTTDYQTVTLTWSNGTAKIIACTNKYYSSNDADWFTLQGSATSPYSYDPSANESVYYRIISGSYTSQYDVGKFSTSIMVGNGTSPGLNWIATPFVPFDNTIGGVLGAQLTQESAVNFDILYAQPTIGEEPPVGYYYFDGVWDEGWVFAPGVGAILIIDVNHTVAKSLTFVGKVPNVDISNTIKVGNGTSPGLNWISSGTPGLRSMFENGLTNPVVTTEAAVNFDIYYYQNTVGEEPPIGSYYFDGVWDNTVQQYGCGILIIDQNHTSATTEWVIPKTR